MLLIIVILSIVIFFLLIWLVALILQARSDDKVFWKLANLAMNMNTANKDALDNCHDIISTNKKLLEEQRKVLEFNKQLTACVNAMARELDKNHIKFDVEKYFPDITSETLASTTEITKSDPDGRELEEDDIDPVQEVFDLDDIDADDIDRIVDQVVDNYPE